MIPALNKDIPPLYLENMFDFLWPYRRGGGRATYSLVSNNSIPTRSINRSFLSGGLLRTWLMCTGWDLRICTYNTALAQRG